SCSQGTWVQQERLCSARPGPITPGCEDSVARHNSSCKVRHVVKSCSFSRNNYIGQQCILGVHIGASFNGCNHRDTDIRQILENLNSLIMDLAPDLRVRHISECRKIDSGNEISTGSSKDNDLV